MKKLLLIALLTVTGIATLKAQNDTIFNITQMTGHSQSWICTDKYDRVIMYAEETCNDFYWFIHNVGHPENPVIINVDDYPNNLVYVEYNGCGLQVIFAMHLLEPNVPNETTTEVWKRQHESTTLEAPSGSYTYLWNTGETTATIEVTEPGTYTCEVSDMCATSEQTFIVQDNVEIYRSTVDLETNLNKVTWQVTEEQAEYINQVKVERDGFVVGTAPYTDGFFLDNIGSENAARNYRLTAIDTDGTECPIPSYQKGTLHVDYSPNASNPNKLNNAATVAYPPSNKLRL